MKDFRRTQRRKHSVASVLSVYLLARLANLRGLVAVAEYAQLLSQKELEAIGVWRNPKTAGRYVPVSKSTLHRVISSVDPEEIEAVLRRFIEAPAATGPRDCGGRQAGPVRQPQRRRPFRNGNHGRARLPAASRDPQLQ